MRINFNKYADIFFGLEHYVKTQEKYLYILKSGSRKYARYCNDYGARNDSFMNVVTKESWLHFNASFMLRVSDWQYTVLTTKEAEALLAEWGYNLDIEISKHRSHLFS